MNRVFQDTAFTLKVAIDDPEDIPELTHQQYMRQLGKEH